MHAFNKPQALLPLPLFAIYISVGVGRDNVNFVLFLLFESFQKRSVQGTHKTAHFTGQLHMFLQYSSNIYKVEVAN